MKIVPSYQGPVPHCEVTIADPGVLTPPTVVLIDILDSAAVSMLILHADVKLILQL